MRVLIQTLLVVHLSHSLRTGALQSSTLQIFGLGSGRFSALDDLRDNLGSKLNQFPA